jgi:hypothetical protein
MLDMEKYMESFKESISVRFEKQEENFKKFTDKVENFEVTHRERLSRLEERINEGENENVELQQVRNLNFMLFSPFLDLHPF